MSVNYADGLSPYEHKGPCGQPELVDKAEETRGRVHELVELIKNSKHMVVITGAGISTSAGIPDFRGPKGVWTLEKKGIKPEFEVTFEGAKATPTHMALVALERAGILKYVISQNVDGMHLRSGFPRNRLSELHGDMFVEECDKCNTQYVNAKVVPTMALRYTGNPCTQLKSRGFCRGKLRDTILDWEDALPYEDLDRADIHARKADLVLCLGTSLQILPCGNLPLHAKKKGGHFVTVNLQATKHEKKANLKIHERVDSVMKEVCRLLDVDIPDFQRPTICLESIHTEKSEPKLSVVVREGFDHVKLDELMACENKMGIKTETGQKSDMCISALKKECDSKAVTKCSFQSENVITNCKLEQDKTLIKIEPGHEDSEPSKSLVGFEQCNDCDLIQDQTKCIPDNASTGINSLEDKTCTEKHSCEILATSGIDADNDLENLGINLTENKSDTPSSLGTSGNEDNVIPAKIIKI